MRGPRRTSRRSVVLEDEVEPTAERAPAHDVLALQRTAGNRAVSAMLQREADAPAAYQAPRNWNAVWHGPNGEGPPPPEVAIAVLDALMRGETPSAESLGGGQAVGIAETLLTILANDKHVIYWRTAGCVEIDGDDAYVRRPAPTEAVAGWLGFTPPLPQYVPLVPKAYAAAQGKLPPPPAADPELKSPDALNLAIHILERKLAGSPFLLAGLTEPDQQILGLKIVARFCAHLEELTYATQFGMQVEGSAEWVRPAPPEALARRLGIGPATEPSTDG
jgi:hypothetical protein